MSEFWNDEIRVKVWHRNTSDGGWSAGPATREQLIRILNPNIKAFLTALWAHGTDVLDWNKRQAIERAVTLALAAALTPGDTHETT